MIRLIKAIYANAEATSSLKNLRISIIEVGMRV